MIPRFLDLVELDFFLVAYGYNLLTQEMLEEEFPLCEQRGISVIIGAVFASGFWPPAQCRAPRTSTHQLAGDDGENGSD